MQIPTSIEQQKRPLHERTVEVTLKVRSDDTEQVKQVQLTSKSRVAAFLLVYSRNLVPTLSGGRGRVLPSLLKGAELLKQPTPW